MGCEYTNLGSLNFRVNDGQPEWKLEGAGADTWSPFRNIKNIKIKNESTSSNTTNSVATSITIPNECLSGLLVVNISTRYGMKSTVKISGNGLISSTTIKNVYITTGKESGSQMIIYNCEFMPGGTITASAAAGGAAIIVYMGLLAS